MEKPIELLTSLDPEIISGGNNYNRALCQSVNAEGRSMSIKFTSDIETYISQNQSDKIIIIDSVAITKDVQWRRFDELYFLIHMWPSDQLQTEEQINLEEQIAKKYHLIHAGRNSANRYSATHLPYILEPGVPPLWLQASVLPELPQKLISIANINGNKGYLQTAQALLRHTGLTWTWEIYGHITDQDTYTSLHKLISKHVLEDRILIKGPLPPSDVNHALCSAHLLLHCSEHENNSMVLRESIAANVPFISTPTGDYDNLSKLGCGFFTSGFTLDDISTGIEQMLSVTSLYQEQLLAVKRLEIPTWPQLARSFLKFIEQ